MPNTQLHHIIPQEALQRIANAYRARWGVSASDALTWARGIIEAPINQIPLPTRSIPGVALPFHNGGPVPSYQNTIIEDVIARIGKGDAHAFSACTTLLASECGRGGDRVPARPLRDRNKTSTLALGGLAMPRMARIVAVDVPHHVTQRGNRRQTTFFSDADYVRYLQLAAEWCAKAEVECWGYCLMPNHVHLILTPRSADGLRKALAPMHWRYSYEINRRERWTGYLWQGRFASYPMDEDYFIQASRYVGLNPVRAGLVAHAREWPWSSVHAHLRGQDDVLVRTAPLARCLLRNMERFFETDVAEEARKKLRRAAVTGRPLGGADWLKQLEKSSGRALASPARGRPRASCA